MVIRFLVLILYCLCYLGVSSQNKYSIFGVIDNRIDTNQSKNGPLKNGNFIYLEIGEETIDSAVIDDDKFVFEGTLGISEVASISYAYGGLAVLLSASDTSRYDCRFTLTSQETNIYGYDSEVTTDSHFHNSWLEYGSRADALNKKRTELQTLTSEFSNDGLVAEVQVVNQSLDILYSMIMKDDSLLPVEKAYILMGDPNFSKDKYLSFYQQFSEDEKDASIGRWFKKKLESTSP